MTSQLRATAFKGDPDIEELHAFFLPDHHFAGDLLWTFGTSLKSAYVNTFEFMNHTPVVQLWRDQTDTVQAVSRMSLGTGEWFHLANPIHRTEEVTDTIVQQADAAFGLLTDREFWATARYESKTAEIRQLTQSGYTRGDIAEVYMTRSLEHPIEDVSCPSDIRVTLLDASDPHMIHERALAQIDAFTDDEPTSPEIAWITRSLPRQLSYGKPDSNDSVIAVDEAGSIVAFADPFYDHTNRIGEFEPVATRKSARHKGLSKVVMTRALHEMRGSGMSQAVVRTGFDNLPAIAAYESVGFKTTDHLIRFRKQRSQ